jgi:hypothetical protein
LSAHDPIEGRQPIEVLGDGVLDQEIGGDLPSGCFGAKPIMEGRRQAYGGGSSFLLVQPGPRHNP